MIGVIWRGAVRAWVAVEERDGDGASCGRARLCARPSTARPDGLRVDCELPSSTGSLLLGLDQRPSRSGQPVGRAMWIDAEIIDPSAPLPARPGVARGADAARLPAASAGAGR